MKTIAVVAVSKDFAEFIKSDLEKYFSSHAKISAYSTEEIDGLDEISEDFVVMSALTVFRKVQPKMKETAITQVISFAMGVDNLKCLDDVPTGCKVLMGNVDHKMCMQVIAQIYEAGYREFDFVPYYGDENGRDKRIKTIVTPDELSIVPGGMEKIINIGGRPIDLNCIVELANKMEIEDVFTTVEAKNARKRFASATFGIDRVLSDKQSKNQQIRSLIELIQDGIILTDSADVIFMSNEKARALLAPKTGLLEGFNVIELIPTLPAAGAPGRKMDTIIELDGKNIVVTADDIISDGKKTGYIVTLKSFEETEEKQHGIRARIAGEKHSARYSFKDVLGNSKTITESIAVAKRMAASDSTVLLMGESGTGKEVFAQSIHNASSRAKYNFVALNCAAIPEHLLESELFGYEEGAFTGAKKGGKIGYFELAHQGSIFLDEIAEMPMALQSKLLRVLEEKTVSRIGSSKLISIDIRVIAATNKDLLQLVEGKEFREDLYYRLNVLPLIIPPLRERQEDISILLQRFTEQAGKKWTVSEAAMKMLLHHPWKGNIRELKNATEYLSSLGKSYIEQGDLPGYISQVKREPAQRAQIEPQSGLEKTDLLEREIKEFIFNQWSNIEIYANVLGELMDADFRHEKIGRRRMEILMREKGHRYTEGEIRTCISKLVAMGFVKSRQGRGGSVILPKGQLLFAEIVTSMKTMGV